MTRGSMNDIVHETDTGASQSDGTIDSMSTQGARQIYERESHIVIDYSHLDDDYKDVCIYSNNNNNLRLIDCRHTTQSNITNIRYAGWDTQHLPRRAALYTEGLSGKWQATNGAQQLINCT